MFGKLRASQPAGLRMYMHPIEISQVLGIIEAVAPLRFLEWGSGGSTATLLREFPCIETYVSVEHDGGWHDQVKQAVKDPRLALYHVPPARMPEGTRDAELRAWERAAEADSSYFPDYVALPRTLGLTFDAVLVDGRARTFCLREGFSLLRSGGVLLLHDAQRTEYHAELAALGRPRFLEPWKQGQLCLVRKP